MDSSEVGNDSRVDSLSTGCCPPKKGLGLIQQIYTTKQQNFGNVELDLVTVPSGEFKMGSDSSPYPSDGEGPQRIVWIDEYQIGKCAVSNREFESFVLATNYKTDAEQLGWSYVFKYFLSESQVFASSPVSENETPWWIPVSGANWKNPFGDNREFRDYLEHPVVHVSRMDAQAFCDWAGVRLPSEAEWEKASRGNYDGEDFPWGNSLTPEGQHRTNIWQGEFPSFNTQEDGYLGTAPVESFSPNSYGLFNTIGNVWEWTADYWSARWHYSEKTETRLNPKGPKNTNGNYVLKGGSYLCHKSYCARYRNSARTYNSPNSSSGHIGFRCARSIKNKNN